MNNKYLEKLSEMVSVPELEKPKPKKSFLPTALGITVGGLAGSVIGKELGALRGLNKAYSKIGLPFKSKMNETGKNVLQGKRLGSAVGTIIGGGLGGLAGKNLS